MWGYGVYGFSVIKDMIQHNYTPNRQSEKYTHARSSQRNSCTQLGTFKIQCNNTCVLRCNLTERVKLREEFCEFCYRLFSFKVMDFLDKPETYYTQFQKHHVEM